MFGARQNQISRSSQTRQSLSFLLGGVERQFTGLPSATQVHKKMKRKRLIVLEFLVLELFGTAFCSLMQRSHGEGGGYKEKDLDTLDKRKRGK